MDIQEIQLDPLNLQLKISLTKEDYSEKFDKQLKDYRKKASLKGFRKGKAPMSIVRKMFGGEVLQDIVISEIQTAISEYIQKSELNFLGQPLPTPDQDPLVISLDKSDYEMSFDLGMSPKITLPDFSSEINLEQIVAEPSEEETKEDLLVARKRLGGQEEIEDGIEEDDLLDIKAIELQDGKPKENGWSTDFLVLVAEIKDDKVKKKLLKSKVGDSFDFDPHTIEKEDENWVRDHILGLTNDEKDRVVTNEFRGTVSRVERRIPSDIDEEFLNKFFGENVVKNEEEALEMLKDQAQEILKQKAENLMNMDLKNELSEKIEIDLPETFLRRWIDDKNQDAGPISDEQYQKFLENTRWNLIQHEIANQNEIEVTEEEVRASMKESISLFYQSKYNFHDEEYVDQMVKQMMESPDSTQREYDNILFLKVMKKVASLTETKEKLMSAQELNDHYNEVVSKFNQQ